MPTSAGLQGAVCVLTSLPTEMLIPLTMLSPCSLVCVGVYGCDVCVVCVSVWCQCVCVCVLCWVCVFGVYECVGMFAVSEWV